MSAINPYRIFVEDFREMEQFLKEAGESMFSNKKFTYEQVEEAKQRAVADAAELFMKSVSGHCADIQKSIKKYEAEIEALRAEVRVLRRNSSTAEMGKAILRPEANAEIADLRTIVNLLLAEHGVEVEDVPAHKRLKKTGSRR